MPAAPRPRRFVRMRARTRPSSRAISSDDPPGPVRGIVVDDENVEAGVEREGEDRPDELGDVLRLVIGRDHHDDAAAFVGHGAQAMRCPISSRTRPGRIPFMQTASGQVCL